MKDVPMELRPRPSSLPQLELCPRWVSRAKSAVKTSVDEAADIGTLVHEKMESLAEVPTDQWAEHIDRDPDAGPAIAPLILGCAEQVRDLFSMGLPVVTRRTLGLAPSDHYRIASFNGTEGFKPGVYCEASVDPVITRPGTGDVFAIFGSHAVYADYKNTFVERNHKLQLCDYAVGLLRDVPEVQVVECRAITPRLGEVHKTFRVCRDADQCRREGDISLTEVEADISRVVARAADPFEPGCPGEPCATCDGNGRCCWQAATLRDIPVDESALVMPDVWKLVSTAATVEMRGQRKRITRWLKPFIEAVDEDDKEWAKQNPDVDLPGFSKTVTMGRASMDKTRLAEANGALMQTFGLPAETLLGYCVPDKTRLAEFIALTHGLSDKDAQSNVNQALKDFVKRGDDIISFRAVKPKKGELKA